MDNETREDREDPGSTDRAYLRNLIIAKAVVLLVVLAVVGLMLLAL